MTPATSSSAPSPNGETDMNDIDIEDIVSLLRYPASTVKSACGCETLDDGRAVMAEAADEIVRLRNNAAAMFDAIETGRQWETIARRAWADAARLAWVATWAGPGDELRGAGIGSWSLKRDEAIELYDETYKAHARDVADRTPGPYHDGGVG